MSVIAASRLIKADALPQRPLPMSFDYADIEGRCDEQLQVAEERARRLLQDAELQAEQLRAAARQMGHATGSLQAEAEFEERFEAEVQSRVALRLNQLIPAIEAATNQLLQEREQILLSWESAAVRLSLAIAERVVHRELQTRPAAPRELIADVLQLTVGSSAMVLRLNPEDAAEIAACSPDWNDLLANQPSLKIVADRQISRGGCFAETSGGEIDGRLETQLDRIAAELLGESVAGAPSGHSNG